MTHKLIFNGTLIDGNGSESVPNGAVLIEDNHIVGVGKLAALSVPADAERIDAGGGTILPGLIDTHVHLMLEGVNLVRDMQAPFSLRFFNAAQYMRRTVEGDGERRPDRARTPAPGLGRAPGRGGAAPEQPHAVRRRRRRPHVSHPEGRAMILRPLLVAIACLHNFSAIADSSVHSTVIAESVPPHILGAAYAVRSVVGFGTGVISPVVFGWALDLAGGGKMSGEPYVWGVAWATLGLGGLLGPLATWKLQKLQR